MSDYTVKSRAESACENAYAHGVQDGQRQAYNYILKRGENLLDNGALTYDMVMGISVVLGIAKVKAEELKD